MTQHRDETIRRPSDALPATMRAATRLQYGPPAEVSVGMAPRPEPKSDEVLVRVTAAGLDRATLHLLDGTPHLARLALGLRRPRRTILGQQLAGVVVAVGRDVAGLVPGDRVMGTAGGTFAEFVTAKPTLLAPIPEGITDALAATTGVSGATAHEAVVDQARVRDGQEVLVLGASGAVGSYAVLLASHLGARVTGLCSGGKEAFVRGLGAAEAHDYRTTPIDRLDTAFDVVIDLAGNRRLRDLRSALAPEGTLVIVGGEDGGPLLGGIQRNLAARMIDPLTAQRLTWFFSQPDTSRLNALAEAVLSGNLAVPVDRRVGLDGLREGIEDMYTGRLRGHVVVCPGA